MCCLADPACPAGPRRRVPGGLGGSVSALARHQSRLDTVLSTDRQALVIMAVIGCGARFP
jgi:hypothetical protein